MRLHSRSALGAAAALLVLGVAQPAAAADLPGCEELTVQSADSEQARVVLPAALGLVDVPPSAFRLTVAGEVRPVTVMRRPAAEVSLVVVVARAPDSTPETIRQAVDAAHDLVLAAPAGAAVAVVDAIGTAKVLAPLSREPDRASASLGDVTLRPDDALGAALGLAERQLPGTGRGRVVVVTGGSAHDLPTVRPGPRLEELALDADSGGGDGCPAAGASGSLLAAVDSVVARLGAAYDVGLPADAGGGRLQVDYLGRAYSALLPAQATAGSPSTGAGVPRPGSPTTDAAPSAGSSNERHMGLGLLLGAVALAGIAVLVLRSRGAQPAAAQGLVGPRVPDLPAGPATPRAARVEVPSTPVPAVAASRVAEPSSSRTGRSRVAEPSSSTTGRSRVVAPGPPPATTTRASRRAERTGPTPETPARPAPPATADNIPTPATRRTTIQPSAGAARTPRAVRRRSDDPSPAPLTRAERNRLRAQSDRPEPSISDVRQPDDEPPDPPPSRRSTRPGKG